MSSPHLNNVLIIGCILAYVSGIISGLNNYDLSIICQVNKPLVNESVVKELSGILRIRKRGYSFNHLGLRIRHIFLP